MSKLSVHLVTWNGAKYISPLFQSLRAQTARDWELVILDNASTDETLNLIRAEIQNFPVPVCLLESATNTGFAGGHNRLFRETNSEYFLLLNQDMYLLPDCLERLALFLDQNKAAGGVAPRLMRWDFATLIKGGSLADSFTDQIDTLGLQVFRSRRVIDMYSQESWLGLQSTFQASFLEVFGASGALPLFRRSVINSASFADGSFFDESYQAYKEDVDLAWRLQNQGIKVYTLLDTVAYHDRSAARPLDLNDTSAFKNKATQSDWVRYHSYKNHLATLYKNECLDNLLLDFPFIFWYELKKLVYFLLFERRVLRGLSELWQQRMQLKKQRRYIQGKRTVTAADIRSWWRLTHVSQESYGVIPVRVLNGRMEVFLVRHNEGHWDFPKGKREIGETPVQTALRELKEETGLVPTSLEESYMISNNFSFVRERKKIHKIVGFFIGFISPEATAQLQLQEVQAGEWLPVQKAKQVATHKVTSEMIVEVEKTLQAKK